MGKNPVARMLAVAVLLALSAEGASALTPSVCRRLCKDELANAKPGIFGSGPASRKFEACMKKCDQLGAAQDAYRKCIRDAITTRDKERCRQQYRHDRPQF